MGRCDCEKGFGGDPCANRTCYNNCYNSGDCVAGVCQCHRSFEGEFCERQIVEKVQMKYTTEVSFVYGILSSQGTNASKIVYSKNVDLMSMEAQAFLLDTCEKVMSQAEYDVQIREDYPCWISAFKDYVINVQGLSFPVGQAFYSTLLNNFMKWYPNQQFDPSSSYSSDVGTAESEYTGHVQWVALTFRSNVDKNSGAQELLPVQQEWAKLFKKINADNPKYVGKARMISDTFTKMDTEIGIIYSTITSFAVSNLISLICVVIFTGDLVVSVFTMCTILLIVITLMGFLFAVMGYTFGAIEAVGVTIFVGMSVDYALHMSHGYHGAHGETRYKKIRHALTHLGVSIIGGAGTTAGAAIFLFFCHMYLFIQLGTMMFMNTLLALFFSLIFLSSMLMVAGPLSHMCDVYACLGAIKNKLCGVKKKNNKVGIAMEEKPIKMEANNLEQNGVEENQEKGRNTKRNSNIDDAWDV